MRRRRLFRYSLRTLLIGTAAICSGLGWYAETVWPHQRAVNLIAETGGSVFYDAYLGDPGMNCFGRRQRSAKGSDSHAWLDFRHNVTTAFVSDAGDPHELCRRLAKLPKLETLSLEGPRFNDEDMSSIGEIHELFDLDLGSSSVTDRGLCKLAKLRKLELLQLHPNVSEACVERLQTELPQCVIFRFEAIQAR